MRGAHERHPSRHRLRRDQRHRPGRARGVLRRGLRLAVQRLRRRTTPASGRPTATARSAGSTPAGAPAPGGAARAALLRRPRRQRSRRSRPPAARSSRGPTSFPGGRRFHFTRPERQRARRLPAGRLSRLSPAARPPGSTRRPARAAPARSSGPSAARGASTSYAVSAPPSSSSARSTISRACSPRAARSTQRGGTPGGRGEPGRCRRFISRSATSGRHRATSRPASVVGGLEQRGPQRAVGLADVGQLAALGRQWRARSPPPRAVRHQARAPAPLDDAPPRRPRARRR